MARFDVGGTPPRGCVPSTEALYVDAAEGAFAFDHVGRVDPADVGDVFEAHLAAGRACR